MNSKTAWTFPDGSVKGAKNFCRNPSAKNDGPWCFVDNEFKVKEGCDVPFCSQSCKLMISILSNYTNNLFSDLYLILLKKLIVRN